MMQLKSYDGTTAIQLLGGLAPPFHDPTEPEAVSVKSLKGLIAPVQHIDQKGATQDGVTNIDSLYDPVEAELVVECAGRDPKWAQRVARDVIAAIDAQKTSEVGFLTHDLGYWWSDVRWFKGSPPDPVRTATCRNMLSLRLRADTGLWKTYDHADMFAFTYEAMTDTFNYTTTTNLGANWPQKRLTGTAGTWIANGDQAVWQTSGTAATTVINGPYLGFNTTTDNQVVSIVFGTGQELLTSNIIGARMGRDGSNNWTGSGVFAYINGPQVELWRFSGFVGTRMGVPASVVLPPFPGEKWTLVCGYEDNPRKFTIQRNGLTVFTHVELGSSSPLGAANRGIGFGGHADTLLGLAQTKPGAVRKVSAGDNATVAQSGFLARVNVGDQKMYDDHTLFGPFTAVKIYDGPGSDEHIEFGPLLANQIVFLRTDPRSNTTLVQDLTVTPPSPQELDIFQDAVDKFLTFAGISDTALADQTRSAFGIRAPQGNLYQYLKGRFSENAAIPAKPAGQPAEPYFVKVEIVGGNADSKVIASGTPLRRSPV
jgi:hypothetical protein